MHSAFVMVAGILRSMLASKNRQARTYMNTSVNPNHTVQSISGFCLALPCLIAVAVWQACIVYPFVAFSEFSRPAGVLRG